MADNTKTYTEDEHLAILADRVSVETAALNAKVDETTSTVTELQTKLDVAEAARVAAEQERDAVRTEFDDYKAEQDNLREVAARKDERLAKVKEVAVHLGDDFFADESRVERIVAMDQGIFEGYLDDLKATAPAKSTSTTAPREAASLVGAGSTAATATSKTSAAREMMLGRFGAGKSQED